MQRHEEVLVTLRRIIRGIDARSKHLTQQTGLTGSQLLLLQALFREGALSAGELAGALHLSQATITSIVDRLEAKTLVRRRRGVVDKRKVLIELTARGRRVVMTAPDVMQKDFIEAFRGLPDWEQTLMLSSLQRLAQMLDAPQTDSEPMLTPTQDLNTSSAA
jgi:DNA-binding MarR family transcriptional regulator